MIVPPACIGMWDRESGSGTRQTTEVIGMGYRGKALWREIVIGSFGGGVRRKFCF